MMYAQNAISVNEMLGHSWDKILDISKSNETLGVQVLKSRGVFPEAKWYWIGFGAMIGFTLLFNTLFTLALTYLRREYLRNSLLMVCYIFLVLTISKPAIAFLLYPAYGNSRPSISEEELKEKHANITGEVLDASHLVAGSTRRSTGFNTESDSGTTEDGSATAQRGMILPFVPLSLTFDDVRYSVDMPLVKIEPCFSYISTMILDH
jgi:hypothetical protein